MLGELIGARYKIINVLGAGGFGHTYIAEDTQRPGNPRCVLKHLTFASPNAAVLQQVRRLFHQEAEALERLGRHDQIPQLLAYFEENQEFYLVQEFVEGHPLSDELTEGVHFSEQQVIALLDDILSVLEFVHAQGVIHRDIKPENLIRRDRDGKFVLIDFGAVKTLGNTIAEATGETSLSIPIYTSGYGASEQCLGRPQFSSDLYSLGMVAIQTLTGMRPSQLPQDFNTSEIVWRDQAQVSESLAAFLERMICYHYIHRYQSALEARQALQQVGSGGAPATLSTANFLGRTAASPLTITPPLQTRFQGERSEHRPVSHRFNVTKALAITGGVVIAAFGLTALMRGSSLSKWVPLASHEPVSNSVRNATNDRISAGEKLLSQWQVNPKKQEGVERFAAGEYTKAVVALESARQSSQGDPETLIYLNNARIGAETSYKIAVAVPLGDTFGSALEILRGVAKAQDDLNRGGGINGIRLKVVIANDDNKLDTAQQLATLLASQPEILGVVGHGISDTTLSAAAVYQANQLVMVSPLSSAVQLSNFGSYIFRTMPSDRLTAKALSNYMLNNLKKRKVVIFFNAASAYSMSLKTEFKNALFYNGVELMSEFDFSRPDFDAADSVETAIAKGAEVIMLAPDSTVSDQAIQIVQLNRRRLKVLAGDSISTAKVLKVAGQDATGLVVAVPADVTRSPFQQQSKQLWGQQASINWRTALAYDATQALVTAMRSDPSRAGVRRVLSQPTFTATGATEPIHFLPSGDRQSHILLMTIGSVTAGSRTVYEFKLLSGKSGK
ncbi:bifunctional serine/threonine-protein kinase/ABC transporter substrate-binding protein [Stenomitos frigidus]|uniref:bifunctional serine/threonine-protein kinase/ABC transporter substrate-binding protein n=1 Tax=Stenomitos frigidus TaxID=1886765 RepID=UPI0015E7DECC|nr:bifunctional serine/threonine-protein kinase/ABC transporter substrate-binding protein [Stenomitos frigidus]